MNERLTAIVGARISEFRKKMAEVKAIAKTVPKKIVVNVEARVDNFQKTMNRVSNFIHSLDNVMANALGGSLMILSPAAVPVIVAAAGALASLGPMIGIIGGSTFALATAFGFAGTAALAFGAAAIPTISKLFDESEKLTKAQKAAKKEFTNFQNTWKSITKDLEKPVLESFGKSMQFANRVLQMARPLFDSAATAANNLLTSLNKSLDSPPIKAFFDYMNKNAGPMFETTGKAIGNIMQGFMSMMVAFGPLAEKTAQGFLKMSQNFAEWSSKLSESKKFQTFVDYVNENMPKVRAIFRDALAGITYFFAAFGPLSSDMMTSLQNMMSRFKEWARTLGENQQFQQFIAYIRENAPKVMTLIGNLTTFLVNLGIGLAPLGSAVLDIVNKFLAWTNSMMQAHPWIGNLIGGTIMFAGAFKMLLPIIIAGRTLFAGLGKTILNMIKSVLPVFTTFKGNMIMGLKMMGKSVATFATSILAGSKKVIVSLGQVIAKTAAASGRFIAFIVKMAGRYAWLGVQALIHAARIAAAWFIAMGPVGWVIATVIALAILIIANWDKVKAATIRIFGAVWTFIKSTWDKVKNVIRVGAVACYQIISSKFKEILSFIKGLGSSFLAAGKGLIDMMAKGIMSAASKVYNAVKGVAQKVRNFLPFSPAKEGPLDDLNRLDFGGPMVDSILRAKSVVTKAMTNLLQTQRTQLALDTGLTGSDFGRIRHDIGAEVSNFENPDPIINVYNEWDGEKVVSYVERGSARRSRITDGFGGK